jgi:serine-type D-Ala-D-Ala carboxypeptidase
MSVADGTSCTEDVILSLRSTWRGADMHSPGAGGAAARSFETKVSPDEARFPEIGSLRGRKQLYPRTEVCYNPNIERTIPLPESPFSPNTGIPTGPYSPVPAYERQDAVFGHAFGILQQSITTAFPAASIAVVCKEKLVALKSFGRFTYEPSSPPVTTATVFDLASVSKAVATTSMAMILYERGLVDLEAPVVSIVPAFAGTDARRGDVTVHMLLAHSSGLPAYEKLFLKAKTRDELLAAAFATPLTADPGDKVAYSDIGFMTLAVALERVADESLDRFCQREIFGPLGMVHTTYNPPAAWRALIPPTADDRTFRKRIIQGEVQDENASLLGGVAGHAGLFATAEDLATFSHVLLQGGQPLVRPETLALFTRRETAPAGTSRALGWDTPSSPSQSGNYFSSGSFGHLGYTGTSLWIEPERQLSIILLTNRTWPDCSNQAIKDVRPAFHNAAVEALDAARTEKGL